MSDTATTLPAPDAGAQPVAPSSDRPYATANASLKAQGATWGSVAEAMDAQPTTDAPKTDAEIEAAVLATPTEEAPAGEVAAPTYEGWVVDEQGRLHRPDGTMANAGEIDAYNASIHAEATEPTTEEPQPVTVTLKSRSGEDVEIEVTDERVAEALRANAKDGMRGEEYRKKMQAVEEHLAEKRAFETMIETNPEGLILQHLPHDKQVSLAVALVAKHWDAIAPNLVKFDTEPASRISEAANAEIRMRDQQRDYEKLTTQQKYAVQLESAARSLIPEHIADDVAEQFLADAARDLGAAVNQRGMLPIDDVKSVLSRRLALYGFDKPASGAASSAPVPLKRPIARAVSRPNQATTAATATVTAGANAGATVRRAVTAQRVAAAVPPAGAGAATVKAPLVPQNADVKQASQVLRKQKSW